MEWLESTTWSEQQQQQRTNMAAVSDPASVVNQLGQQGQELLERSQTMIADMLRGYLGQFQVGGGSTCAWSVCACAYFPGAVALLWTYLLA